MLNLHSFLNFSFLKFPKAALLRGFIKSFVEDCIHLRQGVSRFSDMNSAAFLYHLFSLIFMFHHFSRQITENLSLKSWPVLRKASVLLEAASGSSVSSPSATSSFSFGRREAAGAVPAPDAAWRAAHESPRVRS